MNTADPPIQTVRRLSLSALNSAARTKPHLVRDHLPALLPTLYTETKVNPELIRTVQMGPWTHKVDDGLDARKTAWETLYTLVSSTLALTRHWRLIRTPNSWTHASTNSTFRRTSRTSFLRSQIRQMKSKCYLIFSFPVFLP